jgi:hypothetical protein
MATPSSVQIATTHNFLGSNAQFSLLKPEIDPAEWAAFGEENITGLMEAQGSKNAVTSITYRHFENDRLHSIVRATGVSGGANTNVVYTVDAAYTMASFPATYTPYNAASAGSAAPNASGTTTLHPVRLNEGILFPDGTRGTVVARNTTTFTVAADIAGASLPTVVNTEDIVLLGINVGEGGQTGTSTNFRMNTYSNVLETLVDKADATGTALGEKLWINFTGEDGKKGYFWNYYQTKSTSKRFKNFREMHLVMGEAVTNTANLAAYDATLLKTDGLYSFGTSYNAAVNYNIAAGVSLSDFTDLISDTLDKQGGSKENALKASLPLRFSIDAFIRPEMQAGAFVYGQSKGMEQMVNFGYKGFTHGGYTFRLDTYDLLNNPTLLGANEAFNNSGVIFPLDKATFSIGDDRRKENVSAIRMNYMTKAGSDMEEFVTGGTDGIYTNDYDSQTVHFRSSFGFEGFGANRFCVLQGI